ncbi:MAG TPA: hypothetical protein PK733_08330 [Clostridiales bacterium]|nr:hypothetical protein [Clostridiales bacterium]
MKKVFVEVIVKYLCDGTKIPLSITWENGKEYIIDKVTDIRRAASLKAGGQGVRYKCRILGKERYLWFEDDGRWFVEGK